VEELNQLAKVRRLDITKASVHAFFHLSDLYQILSSGAALGRGCGPLWIGKPGPRPSGGRVAIPGEWTTANLLFQLAVEGGFEPVYMRFDEVMPAISAGDVESGVIIHESRFTYTEQGLTSFLDLGAWWEQTSGLPIPLGGILVRRDLPEETKKVIQGLIKDSICYADTHPGEASPYITQHAQELEGDVIDQHIGLYVNDFSKDLGEEGRQAILALYEQAIKKGILTSSAELALFV